MFGKMVVLSILGPVLILAQSLKNDENSTDIRSVSLERIIVVANKMPTQNAKFAGQVGVLNENDLVKSPSIIENLGQIPGIQTGADYGRQAGQSYNIRGTGYGSDTSESRVIVEQDGIARSPSMFNGQVSSFRVDNDLLKRVEVVKGGSSVLYGSGAIGGVVSMRTKSVDDFILGGKSYGVMVGHRQESNHMNSNRGALAFKPAENLGILLYAKHADFGDIKLADGGRNGVSKVQNDERINTALGKVEWDITDEHRLETSFFNYHENFISPPLVLESDGASSSVPSIAAKLDQKDFSTKYVYKPLNTDLIDFSAQYFYTKAKYHYDQIYPTYAQEYTNTDDRWGLKLKNESLFNTGFLEHRLVAGADYTDRKTDLKFYRHTPTRTIASPNYNTFMPNFYKELGVYLQDIIALGDFELTLGGRYDKFKRGLKNANSKQYEESKFSPKIALSYEIFDGINLLAGYSQTFRAPLPEESFKQGGISPVFWYLPNLNLKPELAKEYEVGFSIDKQDLLGEDALYLKATYYNGDIKDMIAPVERDDLGPAPRYFPWIPRTYVNYDNIESAKRYGYELEAKYDISDLALNLGYDHTKVYDKKTKRRIYIYADKITFGAYYTYRAWGLSGGADVAHYMKPHYNETSFMSGGQLREYINKDFTIVNLRAMWQPKNFKKDLVKDGLKISFGINNVFDKKYIHPESYRDTTAVGKGRNFYVDFEKKF